MKQWFWLALIPSLVFAQSPALQETHPDGESQTDHAQFIPPQFQNMRQDPVYIDVEKDQLTIYPEKTVIPARDLMLEGNEFKKFLDQMEPKKESQYIVLLLRPSSAVFQRQLRQLIRDRGIDVGFEPWDAGREVVLSEPTSTDTISSETQEVEISKPTTTVTVSTETQPIVVHRSLCVP